MGYFNYGLGKGLREPVSPYRNDYIFGADLNDFNADGWNEIPVVIDPATSYDLSAISPAHEVVVAVAAITASLEGLYTIGFRWYRDRDNALLYQYSFDGYVVPGGWLYGYSYIGYVSWEIYENGGYHVDIEISGPESFSQSLYFTVTGIEEEVPEEPEGGYFLDSIFSLVWDAALSVRNAYYEVAGWVWPFAMLQYPLYALYTALWSMLTPIAQANDWIYDVTARVESILSWSTIWSYIMNQVPNLLQLRDWFSTRTSWLFDNINNWWAATSQLVETWIDNTRQYFTSLYNTLLSRLVVVEANVGEFLSRIPTIDEVIAWWGDWTANVNTVLTTWWASTMGEVQDLINSAFLVRDSLWAGWQDIRDQVVAFFSDPIEYLWDRFADWFLGPEE